MSHDPIRVPHHCDLDKSLEVGLILGETTSNAFTSYVGLKLLPNQDCSRAEECYNGLNRNKTMDNQQSDMIEVVAHHFRRQAILFSE